MFVHSHIFVFQVKNWILFNEPHIFCVLGYESGVFAPGVAQAGTGGYQCIHNMVLSHAKAYHVYDNEFRDSQQGQWHHK